MKRIFYAILLMVVLLPLPRAAEGRTLVVYYSFTNDTRTIVGQLTDQMAENIVILVGNTAFPVTLEQNAAAEAFVALLPLTVEMNELNSNEKYYYLSESLPRNSNNPGTIHSGDLMLWGSDCLVLFYETFQTAYSYTPLGRVDNPAGLKEALGRGNVSVTFMKANTGIHTVKRLPAPAEPCYTVGGLRATGATKGIVIRNGKKYNKK